MPIDNILSNGTLKFSIQLIITKVMMSFALCIMDLPAAHWTATCLGCRCGSKRSSNVNMSSGRSLGRSGNEITHEDRLLWSDVEKQLPVKRLTCKHHDASTGPLGWENNYGFPYDWFVEFWKIKRTSSRFQHWHWWLQFECRNVDLTVSHSHL